MLKGTIKYSISESSAVIRLEGKITWETSIELNTFFQCLLDDKTIKTIFIDCSDTTYLDSTLLGILVHFKRKSDERDVHSIVAAPSEICNGLFSDIGLNKVLDIQSEPPPVMGIVKELPVGKDISISDIEMLIKNAHEELMKLNEKNRELFSPVVSIFNIKNQRKAR